MQIYSIQMWLDNPCLSASWGEPWVGIHSHELWAVDVQSRPTQHGMGELQALGKDSVSSRSCSASVLTSFLQFGRWHVFHWRPQLLEQFVEGVTHPSVCGRQGFGKIAWCFHQFFSPLSHIFSRTLIYTCMQSFCLQNTLGALLFGLSGHRNVFSGATNHKQVAVFVIVPLPPPEWSLLSLAVLGLATCTTGCKLEAAAGVLVAGLAALPCTWHGDNACQSQPGTSSSFPVQEMHSDMVNEGRGSGKAQNCEQSWADLEFMAPSSQSCPWITVQPDVFLWTPARSVLETSHLTFNQSAERLQSWDVPELTQRMGSGGANSLELLLQKPL